MLHDNVELRLQTELRLLFIWPRDEEIVLDYLAVLKVFTKALINERAWQQCQCLNKRNTWRCYTANFEDKRESQTKEYQKYIEAGKGKNANFYQKTLKRMQSHQYLGPSKTHFGHWNCKIVKTKLLLFQATKFVTVLIRNKYTMSERYDSIFIFKSIYVFQGDNIIYNFKILFSLGSLCFFHFNDYL